MSDWSGFSSRLLRVLLGLGDRSFVVILGREDGFFRVQLCVDGDVLVVQARVAGLDLGDPGVVGVLRGAGWVPGEPGGDYWGHDVELPAASSVYAGLVEDCVTVMRDVQGVSSPGELGYDAWRERELMVEGCVYSAEELEALDPGESPLVLDLGIELLR